MRYKILALCFAIITVFSSGAEIKSEVKSTYFDRDGKASLEGSFKSSISYKGEDFYTELRLNGNYNDSEEGNIEADRAFVELYGKKGSLVLGKQRIFWGEGYLFNYADVFNEVNSEDPRGDKEGVNGIDIKYNARDNLKIEGAVILKDEKKNYAARTMYNLGLFEFTADYLKYRSSFPMNKLLMQDTKTYMAEVKGEYEIGFWGSALFRENSGVKYYNEKIYTAGADYTVTLFDRSLYLLAEYSRNQKFDADLLYNQMKYDIRNDLNLSETLISDLNGGARKSSTALKYLYNDYITMTATYNNYANVKNGSTMYEESQGVENEVKYEIKADF